MTVLPTTTTANFIHPSTSKEVNSQLNTELSVKYSSTSHVWERANIDIDEPFIFMIVENISYKKDDPKPHIIEDAMNRSDWLKWKAAIEEEYDSLYKKQIFGPIMNNLNSRPLGYKLIFVRK